MQPELPLTAPLEEGEVRLFQDWLRGRGWVTARQIHDLSGRRWDERTLRALAAASRGEILSGQLGYKLTRDCTPEEVRRATAWLRSQARQMIGRSIQIAKTFHRAASHSPTSTP